MRYTLICSLASIMVALTLNACIPGVTSKPTTNPPTTTFTIPSTQPFAPTFTPSLATTLPKPGNWLAMGNMGKFGFTVSEDSSEMTLSETHDLVLDCGFFSGTMTSILPLNGNGKIIAREFTVTGVPQTPLEILGKTLQLKLSFQGTFDETGTHATGNWEVNCEDVTSSYTWDAEWQSP